MKVLGEIYLVNNEKHDGCNTEKNADGPHIMGIDLRLYLYKMKTKN